MSSNLPNPKGWSHSRGSRKHAERRDFNKSCPNGSTLKQTEAPWRNDNCVQIETNLPSLALTPLKDYVRNNGCSRGAKIGGNLETIIENHKPSEIMLSKDKDPRSGWYTYDNVKNRIHLIYQLNNDDIEQSVCLYNKSLTKYIKSKQKFQANTKLVEFSKNNKALKGTRNKKKRNKQVSVVIKEHPLTVKKRTTININETTKHNDKQRDGYDRRDRLKLVDKNVSSNINREGDIGAIVIDFGDNKIITAFGFKQYEYLSDKLSDFGEYNYIYNNSKRTFRVEYAVDYEKYEMNLNKYHLENINEKNMSTSGVGNGNTKVGKSKRIVYANDDMNIMLNTKNKHRNQNKNTSRNKISKNKNRNEKDGIHYNKFGKFKYNGKCFYTNITKKTNKYHELNKIYCIDAQYKSKCFNYDKVRKKNDNCSVNMKNNVFPQHIKARYIRITPSHGNFSYYDSQCKHCHPYKCICFVSSLTFYGLNLDLLGNPIIGKRMNDNYNSRRRGGKECKNLEETKQNSEIKTDDLNVRLCHDNHFYQEKLVSLKSNQDTNINDINNYNNDLSNKEYYCAVSVTNRGRKLHRCNNKNGYVRLGVRNGISPDWYARNKARVYNKKVLKLEMIEYKHWSRCDFEYFYGDDTFQKYKRIKYGS